MTTDSGQPLVTKESLSTTVQDSAYPLQHFTGRLVDYILDGRSGNQGSYTHVKFQYDQLKVKLSTVPYLLETGEMGVNHNDKSGQSPWAHFVKGIEDICGPGTLVSSLIGKTLEIDWQKRPQRRPIKDPVTGIDTSEWGEVQLPCYVVIAVDGQTAAGAATGKAPAGATQSAGSDTDTVLIEAANGKNAADFQAAALLDAAIKNSSVFPEIVNSGDAVLARLVGAGKLSMDDTGVYHKV